MYSISLDPPCALFLVRAKCNDASISYKEFPLLFGAQYGKVKEGPAVLPWRQLTKTLQSVVLLLLSLAKWNVSLAVMYTIPCIHVLRFAPNCTVGDLQAIYSLIFSYKVFIQSLDLMHDRFFRYVSNEMCLIKKDVPLRCPLGWVNFFLKKTVSKVGIL